MSKSILNVLYQSSDYYAIPIGVSLTSLLLNNTDLDEINVYLLDDGISDAHLTDIKKICKKYNGNLFVLPTESIQEKVISLNLQSWNGSYATFYKLFALDEIDAPSNLLLYLDGDTLIDKSLRALAETRFENNELMAAVLDLYLKSHKSNIGLALDAPYFNAGVLLVDHVKWKKEHCLDKIIGHIKSRQRNYFVADQDLINVLFGNRIKPLPPTYNFNSCFFLYGAKNAIALYDLFDGPYYKPEEIDDLLDNGACLYHCLGNMEGRPWEKNNHHPLDDLYDRYFNHTPWAGNEKYDATRGLLAKLQWVSFRFLPSAIHFRIHKTMLDRYLRKRDLQ